MHELHLLFGMSSKNMPNDLAFDIKKVVKMISPWYQKIANLISSWYQKIS